MSMTKRLAEPLLKRLSKQYPVVTVTGPRQAGKTTLCRMAFPRKPYVNFEEISERETALRDPKGFLAMYPKGAIFDEIQRVPELASYIQVVVDKANKEGLFILTGSNNFLMMQTLSQSLAGRTSITHLLPFSMTEIYKNKVPTLNKVLYTGFYPRIFEKKLNPTEAMSFYLQTYIERDLRQLINVKDLGKFTSFLKICASRNGRDANLTNMSNDIGIDQSTVKRWLTVLEASYVIKLLRPYHKTFRKRITKTPRIYFLDTGLLCFLLEIEHAEALNHHIDRGFIFESFVISELLKQRFHAGKTDNQYFFRDKTGHEVDLLLAEAGKFHQIEIKVAQTISKDFFSGLQYLKSIAKDNVLSSKIVYGGAKSYTQKDVLVQSWQKLQ